MSDTVQKDTATPSPIHCTIGNFTAIIVQNGLGHHLKKKGNIIHLHRHFRRVFFLYTIIPPTFLPPLAGGKYT